MPPNAYATPAAFRQAVESRINARVNTNAELQRLRYSGWIVVEQDVLPGLGTPAASAQRNRDYLRRMGL